MSKIVKIDRDALEILVCAAMGLIELEKLMMADGHQPLQEYDQRAVMAAAISVGQRIVGSAGRFDVEVERHLRR